MSVTSDNIEWYLAREGQQHGPLSQVELDKFIELGHLRPTDLVWRAGFAEWRSAADVFLATADDESDQPVGSEDASGENIADETGSETFDTDGVVAAPDGPAEPDWQPVPQSGDETSSGVGSADPSNAVSEVAAAREPESVEEIPREPTVDLSRRRDQATGDRGPAAPNEPVGASQAEQSIPAEELDAGRRELQHPSELMAPASSPAASAPQAEPNVASAAAAAWQAASEAQAAKAPIEHPDVRPLSTPQDPIQPVPAAHGPARGQFVTPAPGHPVAPAAASGTQAPGPARPASQPQFSHPPGAVGAPGAFPGPAHAPALAHPGFSGPPQGPNVGALPPVDFAPPLDGPPDQLQPRSQSWLLGTGGLIAMFLIGVVAVAGWFAMDNPQQVTAIYNQVLGISESGEEPVVRAPQRATREAVAPNIQPTNPPPERTALSIPQTGPSAPEAAAPIPSAPKQPAIAPQAPSTSSSEALLMRTKLWQLLESEFPQWVAKRDAEVRELTTTNSSKADINRHLVEAIVTFRRNNAELALSAPLEQLEAVAKAFIANLREFSETNAAMCYEFISRGEISKQILPLYADPVRSRLLEEQSRMIVTAIIAAQNKSKVHGAPTKTDFETLSSELRRRGWTQSDLAMFSNPSALSKAEPKTVCRLVTDWFVTQTRLPDPAMRSRLISASLRPVVAG